MNIMSLIQPYSHGYATVRPKDHTLITPGSQAVKFNTIFVNKTKTTVNEVLIMSNIYF